MLLVLPSQVSTYPAYKRKSFKIANKRIGLQLDTNLRRFVIDFNFATYNKDKNKKRDGIITGIIFLHKPGRALFFLPRTFIYIVVVYHRSLISHYIKYKRNTPRCSRAG